MQSQTIINPTSRLSNWSTRKRWSDQFLTELKSILGVVFIGEDPKEDRENNTDLMLLKLNSIRVACRVRQYRYYERYRDEFTIRAKTYTGQDTELQKIIMGRGSDYLLYGFADERDQKLFSWWIGDLEIFRLWWSRKLSFLPAGKLPGIWQKNKDGKSDFLVFKVSDLPDNFIYRRS